MVGSALAILSLLTRAAPVPAPLQAKGYELFVRIPGMSSLVVVLERDDSGARDVYVFREDGQVDEPTSGALRDCLAALPYCTRTTDKWARSLVASHGVAVFCRLDEEACVVGADPIAGKLRVRPAAEALPFNPLAFVRARPPATSDDAALARAVEKIRQTETYRQHTRPASGDPAPPFPGRLAKVSLPGSPFELELATGPAVTAAAQIVVLDRVSGRTDAMRTKALREQLRRLDATCPVPGGLRAGHALAFLDAFQPDPGGGCPVTPPGCVATFEWDARARKIRVFEGYQDAAVAPEAARRLDQTAESEWKAGRHDEALALWTEALAVAGEQPLGVRLCERLGRATAEAGDTKKALEILSPCLFNNRWGDIELTYAHVLRGLDRNDEALAHLEQALDRELTATARAQALRDVEELGRLLAPGGGLP